MQRDSHCTITADGATVPIRARAAALLLAAAMGATGTMGAGVAAGAVPPELLARATGAARAPVSLFLSDAPFETVLQLAAEAADLELELSRPLDGTLSGTIEGTLGDVLSMVAARTDVLYDIEADLLEVLPASARREAWISVDADDAALGTILRDDLDRLLPGNTLELDGSDLRVAGHPAFVARTLAAARVVARPSEPVAAAALAEAAPETPPSTSSTAATAPAGPLEGLDDIPGFDTY